MKRRTKLQDSFVQEGAEAYAAALTTNDCPYTRGNIGYEWWLHGWWGVYYKEREKRIDNGELCGYCAQPIDNVMTGIYIVGKHGTTKTVCGVCKEDLVHWQDYQVMAQARTLEVLS